MTTDIKAHKDWLKHLNTNLVTKQQLSYHQHNISFLQHERLIHLLVMILVTFLLAIFFIAALLLTIMPLYILCLIFLVLDLFYIKHYYLLENTLQSWYRISNEFEKQIDKLN